MKTSLLVQQKWCKRREERFRHGPSVPWGTFNHKLVKEEVLVLL